MSLLSSQFSHFRRRRMCEFLREFKISKDTKVLDLGGTAQLWTYAEVLPDLTIVNLGIPENPPLQDKVRWVEADATRLPFPDDSFDVVFCNSLIEHLGSYEKQKLLAGEIKRMSKRYFVQTPNRRFPFDMHMLVPCFHWLPKFLQRRLARLTVWGLITKPSREAAAAYVDELRLMTFKELHSLFPSGAIVRERFMWMTKSLYALSR